MNRVYIVISLLSCLAGIIGFVAGVTFGKIEENKAYKLAYETQEICTEVGRPSLGRDNPAYQAYLFLAISRSGDQDLMKDYERQLIQQLIHYSSELKAAIENDQKSGGVKFYRETLTEIEKLIGVNAS